MGPESDMYWITGKIGAGKSTLMKFLVGHPTVKEQLQSWSDDLPLVLASFYFWNAGDDMQKSQEGLLRILLCQCLDQMPAIAPRVCPRRWALSYIFGKQATGAAPQWTWEELLESFSTLAALAGTEFKLALFVDGLDEFEGNHQNLIEFLKCLHARNRIKICVSSRPWTVFEDEFDCTPSLRMEHLTQNDIATFVCGEFEQNKAYRELRDTFPPSAARLIEGVVKKAKGVFLWVSIVVPIICKGLTDGDKVPTLQAILDDLPTDLSELYQNIWHRISPDHISHSSQLFQIRYLSLSTPRVITFWLADEDKSFDENIIVVKEQFAEYILQRIKRRLNSRTHGLLEVSTDGAVDYLHRSVKEWVAKEWVGICSKAAPDFDPHLALLKALVFESSDLQQWDPREKLTDTTSEEVFWAGVGVCFYHASRLRNHEPNTEFLVRILNRLDENLTRVSASFKIAAPFSQNDSQPLHWSNHQNSGSRNNNFTGITAQFGVLPYVQYVIKKDAGFLGSYETRRRILNCAIFGFEYHSHEQVVHWCRTYSSLGLAPLDSRLALVRLLCENGALKMDPRTMPQSSREREMYSRVKGNAFNCEYGPERGWLSYWNNVIGLLEKDWRREDLQNDIKGGRNRKEWLKRFWRGHPY
jgi:hypothetical protein